MKLVFLVGLLSALVAAPGCGSIERSRDLNNPGVSGITLARQVCSSCHGQGGNAVSPNFPNLAGQIETYFVAQLNGFKSHERHDPAGFEYMWGLSRGLTESQINDLAVYYATQVPARQPIEGDSSRFDAGKAIFDNGVPAKGVPACSSCHGPQGHGQATFPRLASQHADYLVKQLGVFRRTDDRPEGSIMKTVAHELTQQDIEDVAGYIQSMSD